MNTTSCPQNLELFVLDALPTAENAVVAAHLPECAACRDEVALLRGLTGQLHAAADGGTVPAGLRRRLHREIWAARMRARLWSQQPVWLRVAALLVGVLGLGYAGVLAVGSWCGATGATAPWTQTDICAYQAPSGGYPVVSGGVVLAVEKKAGNRVLLAMDHATGLRLWESPFSIGGGPSADGARVYVWRVEAPARFRLAALEISSGREVWTATEQPMSVSHPWPTITACGGVAWSEDRRVVLLDGATGNTRWTRTIPDEGALSVPAPQANGLYVASARSVQALDAADGHVLWRESDKPSLLPMLPPFVHCDGNMLVVVRNAQAGSGTASCRDIATGALRWSREAEMPWHVAVAEGRVFLRGTHIQALDGQTGTTAWSVPMGGCSPIEVLNGCVYTVEGVDRKGIFALRTDNGKQVWAQRMMSSCSGFSVSGHMGYLNTQDGMLRAVVIRRHGS